MLFSVATALLAAVASVNAAIVPTTVTAIRAIDSTSTTLSLSLDVTITLDPLTDITPTTLPFTFGSSTDPTLTFGTGVLAVTPNGVDSTFTAVANATWAPAVGDATVAANDVLSKFCSNAVSEISVSQEGSETPFVVAVNGVGVSIVEQLIVFVTLRTPVTKQSQSQIKIFNPFLLPLTFTGLTATAIAPNITVSTTTTDLLIGTITQTPLGVNQFTVSPQSSFLTNKLNAVTVISVPQTVALLGAFQRAGNALPVKAKASSQVLIGEFPADVTFEQVIPASIGTN